MTKISQYSTDVNITGNDKWIGSDAQNFLITKNFTPNNLANFFNGNNVIDIGTSIRYMYQTLDPGEAREQGTISFETEIGPQVNFSAITTFLIAKNTLKGNTVSQYLDFLVDSKVLLSKASNINIFGYYKITSIEPWIPNTNFFVVEVDFLAGNGFIYEDLDYLVSLVDKAQDSTTPNLQEVTDVGSITTNTITVGSLSGDFSQVLSTAIGTQNYTAGTYAYLDSSGYLGLNNGTVESYLKNTNVTNVGVILEFPNKPIGSYTIATTDDVPTASTLQEVTDEGNTTTNDIQLIDAAEVIFGAGGGILLDNGSRLREGTIDASLGGSKGIAQICAVGYELKWEAGRLYVMNGNGNAIRSSLYNFNIVPTINDDDTKAYYVGSLWSLDNGDVYECTDSTTGAAVWELKNTGSTPTLQEVTDEGNITTNDIIVEGANDFVGQISSQVLTAYNTVTGAYAEMFVGTSGQLSLSDGTSAGILSVNNLDNANVQLEFPDKLTGTYTIATTSDIPTLTSQLTNDVPFLTQDNVVEYPDLASFPVTGVIGTIYIALDTGLFYSWSGSAYVLSSPPNTGITGVGTTNYLPKFTSPTTIGNSKVSQDHAGVSVYINYQGRSLLNGNTFLSIQRGQSQIDFVLGNPGFSQPSIIISDNQTDGFEIHSKGELAIKTGATYSNEGLRVLSTGKLKFTQTPDTGTTSDFVLLRDTSGNIKQIAYPSVTPSPLTTKGDIYTRNSTVDARLPIGLDTQVLIADSSTSTGLKWGSNTAATPTGYYAQYQDVITQTIAVINTGYPIKFRTLDISNGVSVVSNSRITFANTGIYNLQFSVQLENSDTQEHDVTIWLRKNGVDVVGSSGFVAVVSKHGGINGHVLPSWNYLLDVVGGEYYELVWSATSTQVTMPFIAAGSPPPSTASAIFTVTQQAGIMAGTGMTSLTTTGSSGAATYNSGTGALNIPQYMSASTRRNANNSSNNNINYCGVALGTGVSESATVWTITRLTIAVSGSITTATATNVAWTNRESAIYT